MFRLSFMSAILILLAVSWFTKNYFLLNAGAIGYVSVLLIDLIAIAIAYASSQHQSDGTFRAKNKNVFQKISTAIEVVISIYGLIAFVSNIQIIKTSGTIIWFGTLIIWVFGGRVVNFFTGIPLRMGAGGWYIENKQLS